MIRVRFLKATGLYNRGEEAGFAHDEAARLIDGGFAIDVEAAKAKAEAEEAARLEAEAKAKAEAEAKAKPKA